MDVIASGQPRIINDLVAYLAAKPSSDATRRVVAEGGRSSLTCPLFVGDQPTGFIFFTSKKANTYHEYHQSIFRQIAGQVSLLLHRSRMHTELVKHNSYLLSRANELENYCQLLMRY
jgi:GAF domain-containing protein